MKKVLIIDDDKEMCVLIQKFLSGTGHYVRYALTAETGMEVFLEEAPDIVMLDLYIGKMTGLVLLEKIKRVHPSTIVIVVTALSDEKTKRRSIELGADHYLQKPFSIENIKAALPEYFLKDH